MKKVCIIILAAFVTSIIVNAQNPLSHQNMQWNLLPTYSDEFNSATLNSKWDTNVADWGTWSWEPKNAYVRDNNLVLKMQQEETVRNVGGVPTTFYFTSGIAQIPQTITYGYFEARIKASDKGQGTCPAFWLYSVGQYPAVNEGDVKYSEIDVVEIFQIPNEYKQLEMNLHTRIIENGVLTWKRPGQGDTELCHNSWDAPWDPRDDYHTYGVESRIDSIFWFVDGQLRGKKKNYYWHLPMHITVSMGLRTPYEKYIDGVRTVMPYPASSPEPGFPTEMFCDYVRVWEAPAQIVADKTLYENQEFGVDGSLSFECYYNAGSGYSVQEGMNVKLVQKDADGNMIQEVASTDKSIVGNAAGKVTVDIPLSGLTLTDNLPAGNYYAIVPTFTSNKGGGTEVSLSEEIKDIKIVKKDVSVTDNIAIRNVSLYPNPASSEIAIEGVLAPYYEVSICDMNGRLIYQQNNISDKVSISVADYASGVYFVTIKAEGAQKIIKFVKAL